ncbi:MAG: TetR/AcrR family transcriptional regulator [Actinomycetota bacterium]
MAQRIVVEIPEGASGDVAVEVRQGDRVLGTLTMPVAAPPASGAAEPTRSSEDRSIAERGRELIEIACDVISEKGFDATSMRDIAQAADVSIATMYRHVGSKDELLYTITATRMQRLFDHFDANMAGDGPASARLREAIRVYIAYISDNHRYINLVYRETKALDDAAREKIYDTEREFMRRWEDIIEDGVAAGEFAVTDVGLAANLAYFACTVWALRHWSIGDREEADVAALISTMVLGGLAA